MLRIRTGSCALCGDYRHAAHRLGPPGPDPPSRRARSRRGAGDRPATRGRLPAPHRDHTVSRSSPAGCPVRGERRFRYFSARRRARGLRARRTSRCCPGRTGGCERTSSRSRDSETRTGPGAHAWICRHRARAESLAAAARPAVAAVRTAGLRPGSCRRSTSPHARCSRGCQDPHPPGVGDLSADPRSADRRTSLFLPAGGRRAASPGRAPGIPAALVNRSLSGRPPRDRQDVVGRRGRRRARPHSPESVAGPEKHRTCDPRLRR